VVCMCGLSSFLKATGFNADTLSHLGNQCLDTVRIVVLDVTDVEAALGSGTTAVESFGDLDIFVSNAIFGHL